jgi:predicted RNase H-like HicB family nuclease
MNQKLYKIEAFWDSEAQVWVAESQDVPGLVTEADTIESLTDKLKEIIPELLYLNNIVSTNYDGNIAFELISHRQELIQVAS